MSMPQIDPAIYDEILGMGGQIGGMDPEIASQQAMAQRMRTMGQFPKEARMSGRRAVAPNPLELLSALTNQGMAGQKDRNVTGMQTQQKALQQMQVQKILAALMRQQQPQQSGPGMVPAQGPSQGMPNPNGDY